MPAPKAKRSRSVAKKSPSKKKTAASPVSPEAASAAAPVVNGKLFARLHEEAIDSFDEELEMELDDLASMHPEDPAASAESAEFRKLYFRELLRLQGELVKLQEWVMQTKHKLVVIFEGRDAAGKGGVIKRITQRLNPRVCRVVALPAPTERERTQWYFQRYATHLPAGGEIVLFDRSWYNRAGVERVMGFCNDEEYEEFFRSVPEFEKMLIRSGIQVVKYWFSITDEEQEFRFTCRIHDPLKQWKLSPMDLESRRRWEEYTKAKEIMLERTSLPETPWWVIPAVDKKKARLNCIHHLLQQVPYQEVQKEVIALPPRKRHKDYHRNPVPDDIIIPQVY
ncbi:MAG: polyphosphate kinase 2 [Verrucomicrobium sp.]|nr:polyphosphate kinase 2 [Verrucomicrobium sp.]